VPVVAADRSSLPEVCGGAALMVDALEAESIASAIKRLAEDEALRAVLAARGYARAKEFTWERAAALTWDVYRELA
jgi:glycosyltransferase involved in cell wall biosynthesis